MHTSADQLPHDHLLHLINHHGFDGFCKSSPHLNLSSGVVSVAKSSLMRHIAPPLLQQPTRSPTQWREQCWKYELCRWPGNKLSPKQRSCASKRSYTYSLCGRCSRYVRLIQHDRGTSDALLVLGNLKSLNDLAQQAKANYVIHTGDFGFYDEDSLKRIADKYASQTSEHPSTLRSRD